jgi:FlaA1/EpsC-like NDP-sugar epimerase
VNNYGATKFLMERIFQESARLSDTRFTVVRYGNVVGSTGSVIPMFMQAVAEGLPIRLTDPGMTRFWMSPDEAVDTVLMGLDAPNGHVLIPTCRAMTMADLVGMALGYDEHRSLDAAIAEGRVGIIGVRPGEKRHEALVHRQESVRVPLVLDMAASHFITIAPPDTAPCNDTPFEITSDNPPGGWIGATEMRVIIADAAHV